MQYACIFWLFFLRINKFFNAVWWRGIELHIRFTFFSSGEENVCMFSMQARCVGFKGNRISVFFGSIHFHLEVAMGERWVGLEAHVAPSISDVIVEH